MLLDAQVNPEPSPPRMPMVMSVMNEPPFPRGSLRRCVPPVSGEVAVPHQRSLVAATVTYQWVRWGSPFTVR